MTWKESYQWLDLGRVSVELSTLAGLWFSLGVHLSIRPLYIDIHAGWWVLSIMRRGRADWIRDQEAAYREG